MSILIASTLDDVHALAVREALEVGGQEVHIIDPGMFPAFGQLQAEFGPYGLTGTFQPTNKQAVDLGKVTGAFYRRPTSFSLYGSTPDQLDAKRAARQGIGGVMACLPWLSHPADIAAADYKPRQLHEAARAGLHVPRTMVTNNGRAVAEWQLNGGALVTKPLGTADAHVTKTPPLEDRDWLTIMQTAHMYQQLVDKSHDVRVTMVDGVAFAARIDSATEVDWRADEDRAETVTEVPAQVVSAIVALMGAFRLRYAALDFSVDQDGKWWFLEINPSGQWLWLEQKLGLGISDAISKALTPQA